MADKKLIYRGIKLAFFLRHDKTYPFDEHGWREVRDLMENLGVAVSFSVGMVFGLPIM